MSTTETHVGPNKKSAGELTEKTDDENEIQFGEFLTEQYELLKRTLSKLNIDELGRAARVCKAWNKAASLILKQRELNNKIRWHVQCITNQCDRLNCYENNVTFRSQMILGFQQTQSSTKRDIMEQISYNKVTPKDGKMIIPGLKGRAFLITCEKLEVPVRLPDNVFECSNQKDVALFFPRSNRFKISYYTDLLGPIRDETKYGPLQGLLMLGCGDLEDWIMCYSSLFYRLTLSVPLAGGCFTKVVDVVESGKWHENTGTTTTVISFHGDVKCYADILGGENDSAIETFMEKMKNNLGPINLQTEQRMAIVIRDVNRVHAEYEDNVYRKYFPDMPAFVIYPEDGEFCNVGNSVKKQAAEIHTATSICYHSSSVYFTITIPLPPTSGEYCEGHRYSLRSQFRIFQRYNPLATFNDHVRKLA